MSAVFVVNSGSSSIKYQVVDLDTESALAGGLIERIGVDGGEAANHEEGMRLVLSRLEEDGLRLAELGLVAVGHRVVQGGARFSGPTLVTDAVEADIDDLAALAPLHNPANLTGIRAARAALPDVPHVAVFDTAFHATLPPAAYTYAIDSDLAAAHRVRRYGFHGTSHKFVSERAAAVLGRPLTEVNSIVLHLGNGASATAVRGGESVETSMGMTPLEGLVMGTRSGDIDPAALFHLHRKAGLGFEELDAMLNRRAGLLGLSGRSDMRDLVAARDAGDERATLAFDVYVHRIRHYVGAYAAQLGRVDAIVFTAGVGENSAPVREAVLAGLETLGIVLDREANAARRRDERVISTPSSRVTALVIPTNEELEIARQSATAVR